MKDAFTIKEIVDGTGLSRQRIHQLIKSRGIPVTMEHNRFVLSWQDLLGLADNASILNFLKDALDEEKENIDKAYDNLAKNEKSVQFAKAIEYARILLDGEPDYSEDWERWCWWSNAVGYFNELVGPSQSQ